MTIRRADGTLVNQANLSSVRSAYSRSGATAEYTLGEDLYVDEQFPSEQANQGASSAGVTGTKRSLWRKAGTIVTGAEFTAAMPTATFASITPTSGTASGGTNVTIKGTNLDGVTAVTIGGNAVTNLVVVDPQTITATTAAHAAGAVSTVLTDDSGTVTAAASFTFV
jgi:hypothetical protein